MLVVIKEILSNIIIESDSQTVIQVIKNIIKVPSLILNIVKDVKKLAPSIRNIKFEYYNRYADKLVDKTLRKSHWFVIQTVFIH